MAEGETCRNLDLRPEFGVSMRRFDIELVFIVVKMTEHPLRSLLSRIMHAPGNSKDVELVYRHRGVENDELTIKVSTIARLGKGWFMLADGETQIPYHRVLSVKNPRSGEILWKKRQLDQTPSRAP